jgi:hypothetical protein
MKEELDVWVIEIGFGIVDNGSNSNCVVSAR